jgi:hypothetical protein
MGNANPAAKPTDCYAAAEERELEELRAQNEQLRELVIELSEIVIRNVLVAGDGLFDGRDANKTVPLTSRDQTSWLCYESAASQMETGFPVSVLIGDRVPAMKNRGGSETGDCHEG